jgi:2-haloacid dehalogenase
MSEMRHNSVDEDTTMNRREFLYAAPIAALGAQLGAQTTPARAAKDLGGVKALTFDTFGTVVDYRGSIVEAGTALGRAKRLQVDWEKFADAWRADYAPSMNRVRTGELPWTTLDRLNRIILDRLLVDFKITGLTEPEIAEFNRVWHRLKPWPDAVSGLTRLKKKFVIAPLSNGNVSLLTDVAKFGGLPWDLIIGADLSKHYKPDREVYLTAASLLELQPSQIMMVAAHQDDLRAARGLGFRTAFVPRPKEGPNGDHRPIDPAWDVVVNDFNELADRLQA